MYCSTNAIKQKNPVFRTWICWFTGFTHEEFYYPFNYYRFNIRPHIYLNPILIGLPNEIPFAPSPFPPSCLFIIKRRFFSVYMHTAAALYFLKPKSINPFNNMTWVWWRAVTELFPHINQNLLDINYYLPDIFRNISFTDAHIVFILLFPICWSSSCRCSFCWSSSFRLHLVPILVVFHFVVEILFLFFLSLCSSCSS